MLVDEPHLSNLVCGLEHFFFHILGIIIPTDFHIFQRGREITNQTCKMLVDETYPTSNFQGYHLPIAMKNPTGWCFGTMEFYDFPYTLW